MKILQIIYSLGPGGAERLVVDLSNELAEQNQEVYLCVLRPVELENYGFYLNEVSKKVHFINIKTLPGFKLKNIYYLYKTIISIKPDVIHCHQGVIYYILPIVAVFPKLKIFHTIHTFAPTEAKNLIQKIIKKYFYKTKITPISISKQVSISYQNFYHLNNDVVIYNGRKKNNHCINFEETEKFIHNLKSKEDTIIFLHVARFSKIKNQELLINVFKKLENLSISFALLIIGPGYDSEEGKQLKSIAGKNIYFLGEQKNVCSFFLCADAFCLSSIYEGLPISLIEALAYGCVPVCTPVGGIVDIIEHSKTGFLSKSTSEEDYFNAIMEFVNNKHLINREYLIKYFENNFSIEKCALNHLELYKSKLYENES
jgi:glycosyltransferase involved in cell wall biosynthesis